MSIWQLAGMFIGVGKGIHRRKFIVLFTRISGYVCRRVSNARSRDIREEIVRIYGRVDRVGWGIYTVDVSRDFSQGGRISSDGAGRIGGLKMPVILRVFIYACLISRGHRIYRRSFVPRGIPIYVRRSINFASILISLLPSTPFETTSELFSVGILRVRADSCAI